MFLDLGWDATGLHRCQGTVRAQAWFLSHHPQAFPALPKSWGCFPVQGILYSTSYWASHPCVCSGGRAGGVGWCRASCQSPWLHITPSALACKTVTKRSCRWLCSSVIPSELPVRPVWQRTLSLQALVSADNNKKKPFRWTQASCLCRSSGSDKIAIIILKVFISAWTPASASVLYSSAYFYQKDRNFTSVKFPFTVDINHNFWG